MSVNWQHKKNSYLKLPNLIGSVAPSYTGCLLKVDPNVM